MHLWIPTMVTPAQRHQQARFTGRRRGQSSGTHIDNLVALRKTVILCDTCQHRFDWKRHGYYSVKRYERRPAHGECDGCKADIHGDEFGAVFFPDEAREEVWVAKQEQRPRILGVRIAPFWRR